jgi:hypothetical protein
MSSETVPRPPAKAGGARTGSPLKFQTMTEPEKGELSTVMFSSSHLLAAGQYYHSVEGYSPDRLLRAVEDEGLYRSHLLLAGREDPIAAVEFLDKWGAFFPVVRAKKLVLARQVVPSYVEAHQPELRRLRTKELFELTDLDFSSILNLMADAAKTQRLGSTAAGKLLHYLIPEAVMMWDAYWVQGRYAIGNSPKDFVAYQRFGQRLLQHLVKYEHHSILKELRQRHADETRKMTEIDSPCDVPVTKLLDELAYDGLGNRERAIVALGGWDGSFPDLA